MSIYKGFKYAYIWLCTQICMGFRGLDATDFRLFQMMDIFQKFITPIKLIGLNWSLADNHNILTQKCVQNFSRIGAPQMGVNWDLIKYSWWCKAYEHYCSFAQKPFKLCKMDTVQKWVLNVRKRHSVGSESSDPLAEWSRIHMPMWELTRPQREWYTTLDESKMTWIKWKCSNSKCIRKWKLSKIQGPHIRRTLQIYRLP